MLVMTSMVAMAAMVDVIVSMVEDGLIEISRVKDRVVRNPSPGGWRDVLINFWVKVPDGKYHIGEVQICHATLLNARKGLPGHEIYNRGEWHRTSVRESACVCGCPLFYF
jgi:hypothetical protein